MEHIAQIIDSGDFGRLIGMAEDTVLEVKSAPYDLVTSAADRYELAKDVSSLANSRGGYLLIGLRTRRALDTQVDVIEGLQLIAESAHPVPRYAGVIREYV